MPLANEQFSIREFYVQWMLFHQNHHHHHYHQISVTEKRDLHTEKWHGQISNVLKYSLSIFKMILSRNWTFFNNISDVCTLQCLIFSFFFLFLFSGSLETIYRFMQMEIEMEKGAFQQQTKKVSNDCFLYWGNGERKWEREILSSRIWN